MATPKKTTTPAAPAPRLTITVNGAQRELFMSFGLLNEICRGVGDFQAAVQIPVDAQLRDYVLLAVLSERNDQGEIGVAANLRTLDITVDEVEDMLAWVTAHATDFFLRTMERVVKQQKSNEARMRALAALRLPEISTPTPTGSEA
jgi:hypothetical protein